MMTPWIKKEEPKMQYAFTIYKHLLSGSDFYEKHHDSLMAFCQELDKIHGQEKMRKYKLFCMLIGSSPEKGEAIHIDLEGDLIFSFLEDLVKKHLQDKEIQKIKKEFLY